MIENLYLQMNNISPATPEEGLNRVERELAKQACESPAEKGRQKRSLGSVICFVEHQSQKLYVSNVLLLVSGEMQTME